MDDRDELRERVGEIRVDSVTWCKLEYKLNFDEGKIKTKKLVSTYT